jgi:hypothetical protein
MNTYSMRCLRHQQPDYIVGQQGYPQLFLDHLWGQTLQNLQSQRGFDIANKQSDILPNAVA